MKATHPKIAGTKLTPREYDEVQTLVKTGYYLNSSDFLRDAVRDKLESLKIVRTRKVKYTTAKKEVLSYFKKYKEAFQDEAANDLELDLELIMQLTSELKKEGRLEVVK